MRFRRDGLCRWELVSRSVAGPGCAALRCPPGASPPPRCRAPRGLLAAEPAGPPGAASGLLQPGVPGIATCRGAWRCRPPLCGAALQRRAPGGGRRVKLHAATVMCPETGGQEEVSGLICWGPNYAPKNKKQDQQLLEILLEQGE